MFEGSIRQHDIKLPERIEKMRLPRGHVFGKQAVTGGFYQRGLGRSGTAQTLLPKAGEHRSRQGILLDADSASAGPRWKLRVPTSTRLHVTLMELVQSSPICMVMESEWRDWRGGGGQKRHCFLPTACPLEDELRGAP